jgi:hypothetical protein
MRNRTFVKSIRFLSLLAIFTLATNISVGSAMATDMLKVKDSNGKAQFVVTDQGYLGVGTSSPQYQLYVASNGSSTTRGILSAFHQDSTFAAVLQFKRSRGTEATPLVLQTNDNVGGIHSLAYDGYNYLTTTSIISKVNGTIANNSVPTDLVFFAGTTNSNRPERLRITSTGYVGIGTADPQYLLHLRDGAYSDGYAWYPASSRAVKDNVKDLSREDAQRAFNDLNPVTFTYKQKPDQQHVGFIAEDVPDFVANNDRKSLDPMNIIAVLTKVVKEQKQSIDAQNVVIDKLTVEMTELKLQMSRLEKLSIDINK